MPGAYSSAEKSVERVFRYDPRDLGDLFFVVCAFGVSSFANANLAENGLARRVAFVG